MKLGRAAAIWGLAGVVGLGACGAGQPGIGAGARGKADESQPIAADGQGDGAWTVHAVEQTVTVGPDSAEALIRLRVPPSAGQAIEVPPRARLIVHLPEGEEPSDERYASVLYHDYYRSGPQQGTHKYALRLDPSRAKVRRLRDDDAQWDLEGLGPGRRYALIWDLPELVGDADNASTWAISLTSQQYPAVGPGAAIVAFEMRFWSDATNGSYLTDGQIIRVLDGFDDVCGDTFCCGDLNYGMYDLSCDGRSGVCTIEALSMPYYEEDAVADDALLGWDPRALTRSGVGEGSGLPYVGRVLETVTEEDGVWVRFGCTLDGGYRQYSDLIEHERRPDGLRWALYIHFIDCLGAVEEVLYRL
jgi:hypothetical protein